MELIKVKLLLDKADRRIKSFYASGDMICFIRSYDTTSRQGTPANRVLSKLDYLARSGFRPDMVTIKHEWEGVYRIRVENTGRIIGFFDGNDKFIAITGFIKKKRKLTNAQIDIINRVSRIKRDSLWLIDIGRNYEC